MFLFFGKKSAVELEPYGDFDFQFWKDVLPQPKRKLRKEC